MNIKDFLLRKVVDPTTQIFYWSTGHKLFYGIKKALISHNVFQTFLIQSITDKTITLIPKPRTN